MDKPFGLLAELTYRCPLACAYCSNPVDLASYGDELTTAEWQRVFAVRRGERDRRDGERLVLEECITRDPDRQRDAIGHGDVGRAGRNMDGGIG